MIITAIKPKYNFKTKSFGIEVVRNANAVLVHNGFLVFNEAQYALDGVKSGSLIPSWSQAKKDAIIAWLEAELASLPVVV